MNLLQRNDFDKEKFAKADLPEFEAILDEWIEVQEKFDKESGPAIGCDGDDSDKCWPYRERPCIGFLSAAVWKLGGVTLEEGDTKKRGGIGRADLYICCNRKEFFVEAKHMYPRIRRKNWDVLSSWEKEKEYIEHELGEAVKAAKRVPEKRRAQAGYPFHGTLFS